MALNEIKSVLITDDVNQKCIEILENNDFKVVKNTKMTIDQIKAEIKVCILEKEISEFKKKS